MKRAMKILLQLGIIGLGLELCYHPDGKAEMIGLSVVFFVAIWAMNDEKYSIH